MRSRLDKEKLTDEEVDILYDIMEVTNKILNENGIRYSLEGGSLLGAVRNGGLIPHDNDGDFDVLEKDLDKIRNLKDEFAKYDMVIIEVPGWGLQISHKNSPDLEECVWTDGVSKWTSKFPFLDLISIELKSDGVYRCAQNVAINDYPNYHLTRDDWEKPFDLVDFGHLKLWAIGGHENRLKYLDRHYPDWNSMIEMVMDHRANVYFIEPIRCKMNDNDKIHRRKTNSVSIIEPKNTDQ